MKLSTIVREYFTFTHNERIGISVLISLIVLVGIANQVIFYFETPSKSDPQALQEMIARFESFNKKDVQKEPKKNSLFPFNPNEIDSLQLDSLSLPFQVKRNLLKYRRSGGRFYKKEDLRKIYGMTDSAFAIINSYIDIPRSKSLASKSLQVQGTAKTTPPKTKKKLAETKNKIELNVASEAELKSLYGIGEVLSVRIVKYRNLLGGYYKLEQLAEVYGLRNETLNSILPYLKIDTVGLSKININFAEKKELAHHPYLNWENAQSIIDYRSKVGFISNIEELTNQGILNDTIFVKIKPYLQTKN